MLTVVETRFVLVCYTNIWIVGASSCCQSLVLCVQLLTELLKDYEYAEVDDIERCLAVVLDSEETR